MNRRTLLALAVGAALLASGCTGTGGTSKGADAEAPDDPAKVGGTITVLTHRTDLVQDGTMKKYAAEFNKTYPKVKVEFEGLTDYEGEVKIRMNTENYGDVLMIPAVDREEGLPEVLRLAGHPGRAEQEVPLHRLHRRPAARSTDRARSARSPASSTTRRCGAQAGVTDWPTTPAAFLDDLKAIKSKTDAVPYYTNFKDGWPLTQWTNVNGSVSCDTGPPPDSPRATPGPRARDLRVG